MVFDNRGSVRLLTQVNGQSARRIRYRTEARELSRNDERRPPVAEDPDRRVRRTRRALHDALIALMLEKGYDAVTVQDIIDRADVGRSTFYAHFTDKQALLQSGFANLRESLVHTPAPADAALFGFSLGMFRHLHEQRRMAQALLGRKGGAAVLRQAEQVISGLIQAELTALRTGTGTAPTDLVPTDLVVRFAVSAFLATVMWWVDGGLRQSPEQLDAMFRTLAIPGVRAATGLTDLAGRAGLT
jgi:AcrR family transcriptional regulator